MSEFPELHTLWNYNDPAETAVRFQALLPEVEASDDRAYHVELLSQIARTPCWIKQKRCSRRE